MSIESFIAELEQFESDAQQSLSTPYLEGFLTALAEVKEMAEEHLT